MPPFKLKQNCHTILTLSRARTDPFTVIPVTVILSAVLLLVLLFIAIMSNRLGCCRRENKRRHCMRFRAACHVLFSANIDKDKFELSAELIRRELEVREKILELDGKDLLVELECSEKLAELEALESQCQIRREELRELEDGTWEWSVGLGRMCELASGEKSPDEDHQKQASFSHDFGADIEA